MMRLNQLAPHPRSKFSRKRWGRGDKTAGRGHKGQKARAGYSKKPGFEGGQMPLKRRLPKFGFSSRKGRYVAELRLSELNQLPAGDITLNVLKEAGFLNQNMRVVKIIATGEVLNPYVITDVAIKLTAQARVRVESAGGRVEN